MQFTAFNAVCDVELGDKVRFANTIITEIADIRTVSYLKSGKVEFEFELECLPGLWGKRDGFIYPVAEQHNQERWEKAIAHAQNCLEIYRTAPAGVFAAVMLVSDIAKYARGDRNPELLEDLEGIKL